MLALPTFVSAEEGAVGVTSVVLRLAQALEVAPIFRQARTDDLELLLGAARRARQVVLASSKCGLTGNNKPTDFTT